jgi:DNA-binding MarR family transcriptional regulator
MRAHMKPVFAFPSPATRAISSRVGAMERQARDPIGEARRQWIAHGWASAAPGMEAVTTIVRVNQILMARIDAVLRPHGLTFARFEVLRLLAFTREGGLPMGKLTDRLQVHPASVTNAVARLESDGLVSRESNSRDGRSTIARILPSGYRRVEGATTDLNALFAAVGDANDLDRLTRLLRELARHGEGLRSG